MSGNNIIIRQKDLIAGAGISITPSTADSSVTIATSAAVDESRLLPTGGSDGNILEYQEGVDRGNGSDVRLLLQNALTDSANGNAAPAAVTTQGVTLTDDNNLLFDGNDSHVTAVLATDEVFAADKEWTIDFWMNPTANSSTWNYVLTENRGDWSSHSIGLTWNKSNNVLEQDTGGYVASVIKSPTWPNDSIACAANTWHFVAVEKQKTASGWNLNYYLNGAIWLQVAFTADFAPFDSSNPFWFGGRTTDSGRWFKGKANKLRVTAGARYGGKAFAVPDRLTDYAAPAGEPVWIEGIDRSRLLPESPAAGAIPYYTNEATGGKWGTVGISGVTPDENGVITIENVDESRLLPVLDTLPDGYEGSLLAVQRGDGKVADENTLRLMHFNTDVRDVVADEAGTLNGSAVVVPTGYFSGALSINSNVISSLVFNGLSATPNEWTMDFRVKLAKFSDEAPLLLFGTNLNETQTSLIRVNSSHIDIQATYNQRVIYQEHSLQLNVWYHFALTYDGTTYKFYIDGTLFGTGESENHFDFTRKLWFGSFYDYSTSYVHDCTIDEFRLSNVVRWTENFTPPDKPYGESLYNWGIGPKLDESRLLPETGSVSSDSVGNPVIFKAISRIDNTYWLCLPLNEDTNDRSTYDVATGVYGTVNIVSNAPSSPGGSAFFNGSSCLHGTLPAQFGTSDFTVRFWMMAPTISSSSFPQTIFSTRQGDATSGSTFALHCTTKGRLYIYSNTNITSNTDTLFALQPGVWYHIAVVRKSGVLTIYVNGEVYNSATFTNSLTRQIFGLGASWTGSSYSEAGTVYLTSLDVLNYAAYDGAFTTPTYEPGILAGAGYEVATDDEVKNMLSTAGIDESRLLPALDTVAEELCGNPVVYDYQSGIDADTLCLLHLDDATWTDATGKNTVTQQGNVAKVSPGYFGNALDLSANLNSGSLSWLTIPWLAEYASDTWTIEFFAKPTKSVVNFMFFSFGNSQSQYLSLGSQNLGNLWFGNGSDQFTGDFSFSTGTWYWIVMQYDGTSMKVYVDGQLVVQGNFTPNMKEQDLQFGNLNLVNNQDNTFIGYFDEFRWSKGLRYPTGVMTTPTQPFGTPSKSYKVSEKALVTADSPRLLPENPANGDIPCYSNEPPEGVNYNDANTVLLLQGSSDNTAAASVGERLSAIVTGEFPVQEDGSLLVNGSGNYLTIPVADTKRVFDGEFTVDTYIKTTQYNTTSRQDANWFDLTGRNTTHISNQLVSSAGFYGIWPYDMMSGSEFPKTAINGEWQHLAIDVYLVDGVRKFTLYINGTALYTGTWNYTSSSTTAACRFFGQQINGTNSYLKNASVMSLRVSNVARYKGVSFEPPTDGKYLNPPAGYWGKFNKAELVMKDSLRLLPENPNNGDIPVYDGTVTGGGIDEYTQVCLHFDETDGAFKDAVDGSAEYVESTATYSAQGKFAGAAEFSGSQKIKYSKAAALNWGAGQGTVDGWFYPNGTQNSSNALIATPGSWNSGGISIGFDRSNTRKKFSVWMYEASSDMAWSSTEEYPRNAWYHWALVRASATEILFFINGKKVGTIATTADREINWALNGGYCTIGYNEADSNAGIIGRMDEVRFSNTARWTEDFTPPDAPYSKQVVEGRWRTRSASGLVSIATPADGDIPCFDATATVGGGNDANTRLLLQPSTSDHGIVDQAAGNAAPVTLENHNVTVDEEGNMVFDGSNAYLKIPADTLPSGFFNGTDEWTLDIVYNVAGKGMQCLFGCSSSLRMDFLLNSDGSLQIGGGPNLGTGWPFNEDVHLTFEIYKDGTVWKYTIFRNGSVVTTGTWVNADWRSVAQYIGWEGESDSRKINGKIKALRLTSGALHKGAAFQSDYPWTRPQTVGEWGKFNKAELVQSINGQTPDADGNINLTEISEYDFSGIGYNKVPKQKPKGLLLPNEFKRLKFEFSNNIPLASISAENCFPFIMANATDNDEYMAICPADPAQPNWFTFRTDGFMIKLINLSILIDKGSVDVAFDYELYGSLDAAAVYDGTSEGWDLLHSGEAYIIAQSDNVKKLIIEIPEASRKYYRSYTFKMSSVSGPGIIEWIPLKYMLHGWGSASPVESVNGQTPDGYGAVTLPAATTSAAGLMAAADKAAISGLTAQGIYPNVAVAAAGNGIDYNLFKTQGTFYIPYHTAVSNGPVSPGSTGTYPGGFLTILQGNLSGGTSVQQIFQQHASNNAYIRSYNGDLDTWTRWCRIIVNTDITELKARPGYFKLPSGTIVQWGVVSNITADGTTSVVFPIAFPNTGFANFATAVSGIASASGVVVSTTGASVTGFTLITKNHPGGDKDINVHWLAIGY